MDHQPVSKLVPEANRTEQMSSLGNEGLLEALLLGDLATTIPTMESPEDPAPHHLGLGSETVTGMTIMEAVTEIVVTVTEIVIVIAITAMGKDTARLDRELLPHGSSSNSSSSTQLLELRVAMLDMVAMAATLLLLVWARLPVSPRPVLASQLPQVLVE